jgi:choline dehydrogenase-like flavoprotein
MDPELSKAVAATSRNLDKLSHGVDAIVVGAGASGGLAADLLTHSGLRVLVLDAGWRQPAWRAPLKRLTSSTLGALATPAAIRLVPRSLLSKGESAVRLMGRFRQPVQTRCYAWPSLPEGFVDDLENPYETPPDAPFDWIRVHGLGGRMVVPLHGRQYLRHSERDFHPDDGLSPEWPLAPGELDRWYDEVEHRLQLAGGADASPHVPDSRLASTLSPSSAESALIERVRARFPDYQPVLGRFAAPVPALRAAARTGRLLCRTGAVCRHLTFGEGGRIAGVVFYDRRSGRMLEAKAPLVFLCASSLESTRILMVTEQQRGRDPEAHPALGRHLMDHASIKAEGTGPAIPDSGSDETVGRCVYLPRFDLRSGGSAAGRGFGVRVYQSPAAGGASYFVAAADGEMLPQAGNRVRLSGRSNGWGIPTLKIACRHGDHERAMQPAIQSALAEIADICGARLDAPPGPLATPGSNIHECGTARMGTDPAASVLDPHNQWWDGPGVFVTDGSCFPSQGIQNPTLTILALTARACAHALSQRGA